MVAPDIQAIQRKITVMGVIGLVAAAAISTVVVLPSIHTQGGPAATLVFNVTFANQTGEGPSASGTIPYRQSQDTMVEVMHGNLTTVTFSVTYQDNSISPFTNPAVSVMITGPDGAGSGGGSVPAAGNVFDIVLPNEAPENQTVEASSETEALAMATGGANNTTVGSGEWTLAFTVGSALGPRPQGSIMYTVSVSYSYYEGRAQRV
jgi:hypothetical protein